ncbi:hypothetical protein [Thermosulfurimonas dismutans]|uniref:hypothetical protein n=1 Tax=Thermosulfurimonas dismutans TaxID=999894 RepID=UPI000837B076|nr:hypothetical protein [Thermosulfurimonas dismutans]
MLAEIKRFYDRAREVASSKAETAYTRLQEVYKEAKNYAKKGLAGAMIGAATEALFLKSWVMV